MRAIALAVMFLALTRHSQEELNSMSPGAQGLLGWLGLMSFIGFCICLIWGL